MGMSHSRLIDIIGVGSNICKKIYYIILGDKKAKNDILNFTQEDLHDPSLHTEWTRTS